MRLLKHKEFQGVYPISLLGEFSLEWPYQGHGRVYTKKQIESTLTEDFMSRLVSILEQINELPLSRAEYVEQAINLTKNHEEANDKINMYILFGLLVYLDILEPSGELGRPPHAMRTRTSSPNWFDPSSDVYREVAKQAAARREGKYSGMEPRKVPGK